MHIRIEVKSAIYQYLWLKYVTGFDIAQHCARCLIGEYSNLIPYRSQRVGSIYEGDLNERIAPYLYLCGVTNNYNNNLHIAFLACAGASVHHDDTNIRVVIEGAQRIQISPISEPFPRAFATCRNFQFGYQYFKT